MDWPLYKKELLRLGNPNSNTGLCTLWSEKEKVLDGIFSDNYLIAGQCYSVSEGINLIIRHALANKRLRRIVVCGADITHSGEALIALKEKGIDLERRVIGFADCEIEAEIPTDAIEGFRQNMDIIDKRSVKDFSSLNGFLSSLPLLEPWGEPEVYERHSPQSPEFYPSERTGFVVREKKVGDVWLKILQTILRFGHIKKSQYSDDQQEIVGLTSIITEEDLNNLDWKPYFRFTREHFEQYLPQIMSSEIIGDVSYTYGSRFRNFKGINQIESMVSQLRKAIFSRRAVAVTWDVETDHDNEHSPCIDLIQSLAQEKLHMTAYIRSNDMFGAWPENALALRKVQYEIAEKVGVEPGDLIIVSNSAHIYSSNWRDARRILEEYPVKLGRDSDPRGNILIEIEDGKIKVTHLSPEGKRIGEFYSDNAIEAYRIIANNQMISQIGHALDIGVELGKAEIASRERRKYIQDKPLDGF
ncbi:MAG: thymidylate synthase [Nanoarchaeota archaeon]|nr:thymidylate synthase [Nanoarchaeota archaeon]